MIVFIEYRIPLKDSSIVNPWELDLSTSGPIDDRYGVHGIIIPRGLRSVLHDGIS